MILDLPEGDETEESVEAPGGPLVYPGGALGHRHPDHTQAVDQPSHQQHAHLIH